MSKDAPVPLPALTVSAVAARLGVAPSTLRTWDRRYSLGPSDHTAGSHRRYSGADVARLMVMRRLTLEGVAPADAARIALATAVDSQMPDALLSEDGTYLPGLQVAAHSSGAVPNGLTKPEKVLGSEKQPGFTREQLAARSCDGQLREALISAATSFDEVAAIQLVQAIIEVRGIGDTWVQIVKKTVIELLGSSDLVQPGMDPLSVIKVSVMMGLRRAAREERQEAQQEIVDGAAHPSPDVSAGGADVGQIVVCAGPGETSALGAHVLAAALNQSEAPASVLLGAVEESVVADTVENDAPMVLVVVSWDEPSTQMHAAVEYCLQRTPQVPVLLTGPGWRGQVPAGAHRVRTFMGTLHEAQAYAR